MVFGSSSRNSISAGSSSLESFSFRKWMQLGRGRLFPLLQLDESLWRLAAIGVGNADHRHLGDRRMLVERILDPPRIDLEARGVDHVLDTIDDEDVSPPRPCSRHRRCGRSGRRSSPRCLAACSNSRSSPAVRRCRSRRSRPARPRAVRIIERADGDLGGRQRQADRSFARRPSGGLQAATGEVSLKP